MLEREIKTANQFTQSRQQCRQLKWKEFKKKKNKSEERQEKKYQVVKGFRNWAIAQASKAETSERFAGATEERRVAAASAPAITSPPDRSYVIIAIEGNECEMSCEMQE